jgi:hypothetical protein
MGLGLGIDPGLRSPSTALGWRGSPTGPGGARPPTPGSDSAHATRPLPAISQLKAAMARGWGLGQRSRGPRRVRPTGGAHGQGGEPDPPRPRAVLQPSIAQRHSSRATRAQEAPSRASEGGRARSPHSRCARPEGAVAGPPTARRATGNLDGWAHCARFVHRAE